jgi:hypothetical protein
MIVGRTRSCIGVEIDAQYEILLQMIEDIAGHYQEMECYVKDEVDNIYQEASHYDYETSSSITQGYGDVLDRYHKLSAEARKVMFCAVFSYLESMLYGIINFYNINRHGEREIAKITKVIAREYTKKYHKDIVFNEEAHNMIFTYYRPLRNFFMHGDVDDALDRRNLLILPDIEHSIKRLDGFNFEITDNTFLRNLLTLVYGFLVSVEDAYNHKTRELWKQNY